ncbi:MAG: nuclear transport factor 2 family protein [Erythrobacter sp.]|jgi:ketosteroid isomerase-like protein|uniref:nuclear transport factor 2 family protein n=1 Tax=Erythrobacter sp. TaxID=1042 RepID=UPI002B4641D7|nr:nuclear transport factor 2 family protein [Erythrobacter sp.]WRH69460.1 MAG: nuclear transport factor 2 family protein [Erythrobacter sp.]
MSDLRAANIAVATRFYEALAAGDFDALAALHSDDIVFNLVGTTPVSGRWEGKDVCFGPVVADGVIGKLVPETIRFSREWRIMSADENCVVGLMRGGGTATNGHEYLQTYCQIMTIRDGLIVELHEFFDTALVELALNSNPTQKGPSVPARPFAF